MPSSWNGDGKPPWKSFHGTWKTGTGAGLDFPSLNSYICRASKGVQRAEIREPGRRRRDGDAADGRDHERLARVDRATARRLGVDRQPLQDAARLGAPGRRAHPAGARALAARERGGGQRRRHYECRRRRECRRRLAGPRRGRSAAACRRRARSSDGVGGRAAARGAGAGVGRGRGLLRRLWAVIEHQPMRIEPGAAGRAQAALSRDVSVLVKTAETLAKVVQNWPPEPPPGPPARTSAEVLADFTARLVEYCEGRESAAAEPEDEP